MKIDQEFTPKYWVGHNTESDDVYLPTASKNRATAEHNMAEKVYIDWVDEDYYEIILISIDFAEV